MAFFAWEAARESILALDMLKRRGMVLVNRCYLCKRDEESRNHILLWCPVVCNMRSMVYSLLGICWVMVGSVREELWAWAGSCKKKTHFIFIPLSIF